MHKKKKNNALTESIPINLILLFYWSIYVVTAQ